MMSKTIVAAFLLVAMVTVMAAKESKFIDPSVIFGGGERDQPIASSTSEATKDPEASTASPEMETSTETPVTTSSAPAESTESTGDKKACTKDERQCKCRGRKAKKNGKGCCCPKKRV